MKKTILFITLLSVMLSSEEVNFRELAKLASEDLGKNIFIDEDIEGYTLDFNIHAKLKRGELYEYFKIMLTDNNMSLQYNKRGDFYFVRDIISPIKPTPPPTAPKEIHSALVKHYYTYKIKNITNVDVLDSLEIFENIKYKYLKQSDMIAYSATVSQHKEIRRILKASDRSVFAKSIKITIFSINKNKLKEIGTSFETFGINLTTKIRDNLSSSSTSVLTFGNEYQVNAYLKALNVWGVTSISQSPTLLLTNGIETTLESVANIRYSLGSSSVSNTVGSTTSENYQYKDVGLKINIKPKIKKSFVYLDLSLISEDLISLEEDNPRVVKIAYKNSFKVKKGKPLLLTGINKTIIKNLKSSIPFLSDLPLIGFIFKGSNKSKEEQNINIMIEVL
ncbi:type II and III secretion system protein [Sulfurovum sp. bin170]|uniref:type II and III secretion system protein n=1 Tax=Sulfurovum sp. bin170 TaxID=2695268 RepID=UPI0013DE904C|nr:type II and III secretion system protein [Sulfurovum sp. bin170]NEW61760.1 type II and III secretion system protein [Sulfurovum sp. bin170]